jgi:hypothetical protein
MTYRSENGFYGITKGCGVRDARTDDVEMRSWIDSPPVDIAVSLAHKHVSKKVHRPCIARFRTVPTAINSITGPSW